MKNKQCIIIGAGKYSKKDWKTMESLCGEIDSDSSSQNGEPLYIAADGGYHIYKKMGIIPDVWIGDFDSSVRNDNNVTKELIELSKEKDDTDMLAAIRIGLDRGCNEFHILGGTGKRVEHMIANLQCLSFLCKEHARGYLYGENRIFTVIKNERYFIQKRENVFVSIFSLTEQSLGVTLNGFKYPLINATIKKDFPIGVSNELANTQGEICVKNGELLLVF